MYAHTIFAIHVAKYGKIILILLSVALFAHYLGPIIPPQNDCEYSEQTVSNDGIRKRPDSY